MKPLRQNRLAFIRKELDQIGVAVSVVGTGRPMLRRLSGYGDEMHDSLHGSRDEVRKLQNELRVAIHNLSKVNPRDAKKAHRGIWVLRDLADKLTVLRRRGIGEAEPEIKMGRLRLDNVYGYTDRELKAVTGIVRSAVETMGDWGLFRKVVYGDLVLDPEDTGTKLARYLSGLDAIAVNPDRWTRGPRDLYEVFGDRIWLRLFDGAQHEVWGMGQEAWGRFTDGFVEVLDGRSVSADTEARLAVTMAKVTKSRRWMSAVA